jgi:hypothetical protein
LLLRDFEPAPLPVHLLYSERGRLPLKLRALVDFAAPRLRARLHHADAALAVASASKPGVSRPTRTRIRHKR